MRCGPAGADGCSGRTVYRVVWKLGTDVLVGDCWCGAAHEDADPVALWEWLLAHPDTHDGGRDRAPADPGRSRWTA